MIVATVDDRYVDGRTLQSLGGIKAAEAAA